MKILICGDSFAADWTVKYDGKGWPNLLEQDHTIKNLAQAGCSEYKIYKQIISQNLDDFDVIIISHTSACRWYIETKHPIHHADPLHKNSDLIYTDIEEHHKFNLGLSSILNFFQKFYSIEYAEFVHELISERIFNITKDKKVIHLTHINTRYNFPVTDFSNIFKKHRGIMNHYSDKGNHIIFKKIMEILK